MTRKAKPTRKRRAAEEGVRPLSEIMKGFPDPGPFPKVSSLEIGKDGRATAKARAIFEEHSLRFYVYHAMHSNDSVFRERLLRMVIGMLPRSDLPVPVIEWLTFFLVSERHHIPTFARGRPSGAAEGFDTRYRLREIMLANADVSIDAGLHKAAEELCKSYSVVKAAFYSDAFSLWRLEVSQARKARVQQKNKVKSR